MDIEYKGANCVTILHKKDTFVVDPKLSDVGLKDQGAHASVQLLTEARFGVELKEGGLTVEMPGEYEVRDITVTGIEATSATDMGDSSKKVTVYKLAGADLNIAILGHISQKLNEDQLEEIGVVDVLILPVGNHGYTLDPKVAVAIAREVSPKIVIPTHYDDKDIKYEVPQLSIEEFIKELGAPRETVSKLKLKAGQLPENLTIYEITRSS